MAPMSQAGTKERNRRALRLAQGADWDWQEHAFCRNAETGYRMTAWSVDPHEEREIGAETYLGEELIAYAQAVCSMCPAQWDCARFALHIEAAVGVWGGVLADDLRKLKRRKMAVDLIDAADARDVPVQVALTRYMDRTPGHDMFGVR